MAKRGSDRRESDFDPVEFDMRREHEYLYRHPAPRGMDDYAEDITIVRSTEEFEHRNKMIEEIRGSDLTREQMRISTAEVNYNSHGMGILFSNILISYLMENRVHVPEINFRVYFPTAAFGFSISQKIATGADLPEQKIKTSKSTLSAYTKKWLDQSRFKEYIDAWGSRRPGMSDPHPSRTEGGAGSVQIDPRVLVTRRCALIPFNFYHNNQIKGHEIFMFWQIREEGGEIFIEYGICDNLGLHEKYRPLDKMNFDFYRVIKEAFRDYLLDCRVDDMNIFFRFIRNLLPFTERDQPHYKEMVYTCMSVARRAILYFGIFYDIFRLNDNEYLEQCVRHEELHDDRDLTRKELLYVMNYVGYTHYMNKMFEWVLSSPLLWPEYDPTLSEAKQVRPTRERPLCVVLFPLCYQLELTEQVYLRHHGDISDINVWIDLIDAPYIYKTFITLYNYFEGCGTRYYFHMDGGEVFRPHISSYDGGTCCVSAAADFSSVFGALSALHQRLKVLELI